VNGELRELLGSAGAVVIEGGGAGRCPWAVADGAAEQGGCSGVGFVHRPATGRLVTGKPALSGLDTVAPGSTDPMQLAELKALTPQLEALLAQYGASNLAVFGSVARDQARAGSDVDLLVDLPQGTSLLDHSALKLELEDLLQQKVDLIRRRNLKPSLRQRVEAEAVALG
jgi:uncharacterized protein